MVDKKLPSGTEENEALKALIKKYQDVFPTEKDPLTVTSFFMHTLKQMDEEVVYKKPYPIFPFSFDLRTQDVQNPLIQVRNMTADIERKTHEQ